MRRLASFNWLGLLTMLGLLGLWQALVVTGVLDYEYLPAPADVAQATGRLALSGDLAERTGHTLRVVLLGWLAAGTIGIWLGLLLGLSDRAWRWSMASFEAIRAMPRVAAANQPSSTTSSVWVSSRGSSPDTVTRAIAPATAVGAGRYS